MDVPLEISFRDVVKTDDLEALIRDQATKLERVCNRLASCRVAVEQPHRHPKSGSWFRVRIDLTVPPGKEIAVKREPGEGDIHEDLHHVIVSTFKSAKRKLRDVAAKNRGAVKTKSGRAGDALVRGTLKSRKASWKGA